MGLKKDRPIEGSKPLHFPTRSNLTNVDLKTTEDIKKFNKNKKLIKKFVKSYSAFLIPGTKKREIDSHLSKKLKERGKPPFFLDIDEERDVPGKVKRIRSTIKLRFKKELSNGTVIGNVSMDDKILYNNVCATLDFLIYSENLRRTGRILDVSI